MLKISNIASPGKSFDWNDFNFDNLQFSKSSQPIHLPDLIGRLVLLNPTPPAHDSSRNAL